MNHAQAVKRQVGKEVKQVAGKLDCSREKVYKLIDGTYPNHPVEQTGKLAASTDSHEVAKYVAECSGCRVVEPFSPTNVQDYAIIPLMAVEFGELAVTLGEVHKDGIITPCERDQLRAAMNKLGGVMEGYLQYLEEREGL